ncbi:MAG: hypothetical protein GF355_07745 [Candidatus Eisenbacteria bacterium]|nr:hypothetical protein [Candidatus Eisenbacteria bacterium]
MRKIHDSLWCRVLLTAVVFGLAAAAAAQGQVLQLGELQIPEPVGHVNDFAGVLQRQDRQMLEAFLRNLDQKTGAQFAVVTLPSLKGEQRADVAVRLFERWGIGHEDDRGLLLLDVVEDRELRIEVGYGLEGILPDGYVGQLRDQFFTEPFRGAAQISPPQRYRAYLGVLGAAARRVAEEQGIKIEELTRVELPREPSRSPGRGCGGIGFIVLLVIFLFVFRRNPLLGMFLLMGMGGGMGRRRGGMGGSFGSFGGGFGGFGGGMSGGGGAGGGY